MSLLKSALLFLTAGVLIAASDVERLSDQAQQALNAHHWTDASSALEQLAKLAPDVPEVYANLGLAYYFQGRAAQALASFKRALHLNPEMPQATIMSGICQGELGHHPEAIAILDPAFRSPTDSQIGRLIGLHLEDSYAAVKQFDKASVVGEELLRRYPNDPEILFQVSRLHADRSYQLMTDLVRAAPDSPWVHYANAQVQEGLQHYDVAIQEYENVLKAEPGMPSVHYQIGTGNSARIHEILSPFKKRSMHLSRNSRSRRAMPTPSMSWARSIGNKENTIPRGIFSRVPSPNIRNSWKRASRWAAHC